MKSNFSINQNKGFTMTFENGLTISVQFGSGNYCENRNYGMCGSEMKNITTDCNDAEIAIWDEKGVWFNFGSDEVKGYVDANEVAEWIIKTKNAIDINSIVTPLVIS